MNVIRRSAWVFMVVMLGAAAGCTEEEGTPAPSDNPPPSPSMAPAKPAVPPPTKTEAAKESASKEMQPAPAKPAETQKPDESKKDGGLPKVEGPKHEDSTKGGTAAVKLTPDEIAAIKELPAADQELALKQAVCPVSNDHLGEMGKPFKSTVEGRTVFLCCDHCEKDLKADPKSFFAKLDAQAGKK